MLVAVAVIVTAAMVWARLRPQRADAWLYYRRGGWGGIARCPVNRDVYHIGRQPGNELRLRDRTVSRQHAEIVRNRNGTHYIRDLGSINGLYVGRRHVDSSMLSDGDVIRIGSVRMKFVSGRASRSLDAETVVTGEELAPRPTVKRRRAQRQDVKVLDARVFSDVSGWIAASIIDLSEDGAQIEVNHLFDPKTPVDLVFPVQTEEVRRWLRLIGEVVRAEGGKVGIAFRDVDNASRRHLQALLARNVGPAGVPAVAAPAIPHGNPLGTTRLIPQGA